MGYSLTNHASNNSALSGTGLGAFMSGVAVGALVVVCTSWDETGGTTGSTVVDDLSVAATNKTRITGHGQSDEIWRYANYGGGTRTITLNNSPNQSFRSITVMEFAGSPASPDDGVATNSATSTSPSSGNLSPAPSVDGELIVGFAVSAGSGTITSASPSTDVLQGAGSDVQYYIQPTAASFASTWTDSANEVWEAAAVSFKPALAVVSLPPRRALAPQLR